MLKLYGPHIYWSTNSEDNTPKSRRARRGILLLGRVELSDQQWLVSVCQWDNRVGRFNESIILLIVGRRGASGERGTSSVGNKWRISKEHGTWRCFQRLCKFSETERVVVVVVDLFWFGKAAQNCRISSIDFNKNSSYMVTASDDDSIRLYDVATATWVVDLYIYIYSPTLTLVWCWMSM